MESDNICTGCDNLLEARFHKGEHVCTRYDFTFSSSAKALTTPTFCKGKSINN